MADMMGKAAQFLAKTLKNHAAIEVKYTRGAWSVDVLATQGSKLMRHGEFEDTSRIEWTDKDFLINASDLIIAGEKIEPQRGDMISIPSDEGKRYYEVSPYGNDPAWKYSDPYRTILRIHTKLVEVEGDC